MTLWQLTLLSVLAGFVIDCLAGDPHWIPHPVVLIGKFISFSEKTLRRLFPKTDRGAFRAGLVTAVIVPLVSATAVFWILFGMWKLSPWAYFAMSAIMCWQCFAAKCLATEANKVAKKLETEGLDAGRKQVSMLVGRDTEHLSEEQVWKATVETVAENASDGVIAPMLYMLLFGAVGGFFYKAINTMDSMIGYKNDRYLFFGRAAAKLDDAANFVPARLSALAMIVSAPFVRLDGKNAFRIWKRDKRKHASPNSAQTESAAAGALHVQLAGPASYFGKRVEKPYLGDDDRPIERKDVSRTNRLMYGASVLVLVLLETALLCAAFFGGTGR
jgi:adenosylcobinamide-phosphate synthase